MRIAIVMVAVALLTAFPLRAQRDTPQCAFARRALADYGSLWATATSAMWGFAMSRAGVPENMKTRVLSIYSQPDTREQIDKIYGSDLRASFAGLMVVAGCSP